MLKTRRGTKNERDKEQGTATMAPSIYATLVRVSRCYNCETDENHQLYHVNNVYFVLD